MFGKQPPEQSTGEMYPGKRTSYILQTESNTFPLIWESFESFVVLSALSNCYFLTQKRKRTAFLILFRYHSYIKVVHQGHTRVANYLFFKLQEMTQVPVENPHSHGKKYVNSLNQLTWILTWYPLAVPTMMPVIVD